MREQIITEIKRLSIKHGRPIGRELFEKETAIGKHAWLGVYWARWGDALAEAGLEQNSKTPKIDPEFYYERLAGAFRHFHKIPTTTELRLYRNIDPSMPAHSTFDKTFGSKEEMLRRLKTWAASKAHFSDIFDMLSEITDKPEPEHHEDISVKEGWVYILKYGDFYKIGAGSDLERRVKQIATKLPEDGELLHAIRTDDPFGIEAYWHKRFAEKRAKNNSEFFKLSPKDVRVLKKRKFM
ncbi:GIY-YIG nuclease family protein [Asticcacaulis sp.]|uniref:GIY-YIG nuclease family protein n=1 Tax=Asticcacaulis sp. TaxID=1872648 RepID=UPI003F7B918F